MLRLLAAKLEGAPAIDWLLNEPGNSPRQPRASR